MRLRPQIVKLKSFYFDDDAKIQELSEYNKDEDYVSYQKTLNSVEKTVDEITN